MGVTIEFRRVPVDFLRHDIDFHRIPLLSIRFPVDFMRVTVDLLILKCLIDLKNTRM